MTENATRVSPNASLQIRSSAGFVIALGAAAVMTLVGAFGTIEVPWLPRSFFWFTVMISGAMIGTGVTNLVQSWGKLSAQPWLEAIVIAAGIAAPLNLIVTAMSAIVFDTRMPSLLGLLVSFGNVFLIALAIVALTYALAWQRRSAEKELAAGLVRVDISDDAPRVITDQRFRNRLPLHLQAQPLLAVASEDHYLRVYCADGDALILLRLADALAELSDVPGAQTHRSWWVAKDAVMRVERGPSKATLHLANGIAAPVSRSFLPVLARIGWR